MFMLIAAMRVACCILTGYKFRLPGVDDRGRRKGHVIEILERANEKLWGDIFVKAVSVLWYRRIAKSTKTYCCLKISDKRRTAKWLS